MNISELIKRLEEIKQAEGDLPVYIPSEDGTIAYEGAAGQILVMLDEPSLPKRVLIGESDTTYR